MVDFWIEVLLTIAVTTVTVFADWVARQLITARRSMASIRRAMEQTIPDGPDAAKLGEIKRQVDRYYDSIASNVVWGSDLASIAFSLDVAVMGVWSTNHSLFPFFSRWSTDGASRDVPVWSILLLAHFAGVLVSMVLKHYHTDSIESMSVPPRIRFMQKGWFGLNRYVIASNSIGFVCLLSSFLAISNRLPFVSPK